MQGAVGYRGKVKYDKATALEYKNRPSRQHTAEMALIDRAFELVPRDYRILDLPCGAGRVSVHLAKRGYEVSCADYSEAMLDITRQVVAENGLHCPVEKQDIEALTFADRQFDAVICFRLFHHFPNAALRQKAVSELCRVARKQVAVSYFSPFAVTTIKRRLQARFAGRVPQKHATPLAEVERYFRTHGFRLVRNFARSPFLHTLHLALFERVD